MALDFWTDYYFSHPNDPTESFEVDEDEFERDVQEMLAEDDNWETVG